jgi:prophage regulatory protein
MDTLEEVVRRQIVVELSKILHAQTTSDMLLVNRVKDAVLKRSAVTSITGLPASSIYRKVAEGTFPPPIKLGEASSGWLLSEIERWIVHRREARDIDARHHACPRGGKAA